MTADLASVLEEIALGEADLSKASVVIANTVSRLDDDLAAKLYESLRSFVWKALEARRRDAELLHWLDVVGRVSASLVSFNYELSIKLEAYAELLHTSIARAAAPSEGLFERKHVRNVVSVLLRATGSVRKRDLLAATGLKEANLARIMAPLRDAGWVERSMDGKEAIYQITKAGIEAVPAELRAIEAKSLEKLQDFRRNYQAAAVFTRTDHNVRWRKDKKVYRNLLHGKHEESLPSDFQFTDLMGYNSIIQIGDHPRESSQAVDGASPYLFAYDTNITSLFAVKVIEERR